MVSVLRRGGGRGRGLQLGIIIGGYNQITHMNTYTTLAETAVIKTVSETATEGSFEIEGLYTGYGLTLGNALRRVLISSLPGAAVTRVKIKGVSHEFSTMAGVNEDVVELALNLKKVRFRMHTDEPQTVTLKVKGERAVTAADIETNAMVEVVNPDAHIGELTAKSADLDMELTIERGLGYLPVEATRAEKLPIGVIALDAIFTPVLLVNFVVENMRVGDRTDYNRLKLAITTDGSITPSFALRRAAEIISEHAGKVAAVAVLESAPAAPAGEKKKRAKKS
jgi:DNA-directed RNA polymerase subunit alpha